MQSISPAARVARFDIRLCEDGTFMVIDALGKGRMSSGIQLPDEAAVIRHCLNVFADEANRLADRRAARR